MKAAPIQLQQLSFRRVSVAVNEAAMTSDDSEQIAQNLAFDRCMIATHVHFAPVSQADTERPTYLLTLRVVVDGTPTEGGSECKLSPYLVDIEAGGIIGVTKGAEKLDDVEEIVLVNGTSMLWAAIREQVSNLTARMPLGIATLPTVHFQDLRKQRSDAAEVPAKQGRRRVAKPRSKHEA